MASNVNQLAYKREKHLPRNMPNASAEPFKRMTLNPKPATRTQNPAPSSKTSAVSASPQNDTGRRLQIRRKAHVGDAIQKHVQVMMTLGRTSRVARLHDHVDEDVSVEEKERRTEKPRDRWRRVLRTVRILCSACTALRERAMDAGFLNNYLVAVTGVKTTTEDGKEEELTFNLADFVRNRELKLPKQIVDLLDKRPADRTNVDIIAIARSMRQSLPSFRKYTDTMQKMMCRIMRYMRCGKRRVVLRRGHKPYSVYFIYSGSVSVVMDEDEDSVLIKTEKITLGKGACFGEVALVGETLRNATVVCSEDAELLVIDKEDYVQNNLHMQSEEEVAFRCKFFRSWPPLAHWTDADIRQLSYVSRMEDCNYNKVVVKDSTRNEWLWFVVKGSCEVLRLIDIEKFPEYDRLIELRGENPNLFAKGFYDNRPCFRRALPRNEDKTIEQRRSSSTDNSRAAWASLRRRGFSVQQGSSGAEAVRNSTNMAAGEGDSLLDPDDVIHSVEQAAYRILAEKEKLKKKSKVDLIDSGIFVQVGMLRDGRCFGLELLYKDDEDEHVPIPKLALVSKGCSLIQIPRVQFKAMTDRTTLRGVRDQIPTYPEDQTVLRRIIKDCEWDLYKQSVIESVVADREMSAKFEHTLRAPHRARAASMSAPSSPDKHVTSCCVSPMIGYRSHSPHKTAYTRPNTAVARSSPAADSIPKERNKSPSRVRPIRPQTCPSSGKVKQREGKLSLRSANPRLREPRREDRHTSGTPTRCIGGTEPRDMTLQKNAASGLVKTPTAKSKTTDPKRHIKQAW